MIYKVSYLLATEDSPGIIRTTSIRPYEGEIVLLEAREYVVTEIAELSQSQPETLYLLVRLKPRPPVTPGSAPPPGAEHTAS